MSFEANVQLSGYHGHIKEYDREFADTSSLEQFIRDLLLKVQDKNKPSCVVLTINLIEYAEGTHPRYPK